MKTPQTKQMNTQTTETLDTTGHECPPPRVIVEESEFGTSFILTVIEDDGTTWKRHYVPLLAYAAPTTSHVIKSWKEGRGDWKGDPTRTPLKLTYHPDVTHWKAFVKIHANTPEEEGDEAIFNDEEEALSWCQQHANQENEPVVALVSRVTLYTAEITIKPS